ncbi:MAG: flagellar motor switch protein FliN [Nitrospinota bacterium]|nr:flagellar motor switch protein FliN [Nitrospinota bacterium]
MVDDNLESDDDLWGAAADDLEKQREMLREEVESNPEGLTSGGGALATGQPSSRDDVKYARVLDIPLTLSVEMGKAKMLINDLLQLGQGSVIELTKLVGEPLDVLVNDKLVAKGEVVVVNEKFGVRLTEVITPQERIENLG